MCISNNSYEKPRVDFKDTILYGAVVLNPETNAVEHLLGYFNKVETLSSGPAADSDFGWDVKPGSGDDFGWDIAPAPRKVGNAMLFAVPAAPGTLNAKSLIPVKDIPKFMQDYKRAVAPREKSMTRGGSRGLSFGIDSAPEPVVVKGFDGGTYDVVISPTANQIASVIAQVDEDKRPQLNAELYDELNTAYPGFTFVLFCFSETSAEQAGCALIRYTPKVPHILYLPGLDGHNGFIERGNVTLNHTLVLGHYQMAPSDGLSVSFSDDKLRQHPAGYGGGRRSGAMSLTAPLPKLPYYILPKVIGRVINDGTIAPQGDFLASVEDVKKGTLRVRRQVPPGWSKLKGNPTDPAGVAKYYITATSIGAQQG